MGKGVIGKNVIDKNRIYEKKSPKDHAAWTWKRTVMSLWIRAWGKEVGNCKDRHKKKS